MRRKWLKLPQGLPADTTLALCAHKSGLSRAEMLALWLAILDEALTRDPPGALEAEASTLLALKLDLPADKVTRALAALAARKWLTPQGRVLLWEKYQGTSTARVRAHRARKKQQPAATPSPAPRAASPSSRPDPDSPAAIAARRARMMQARGLPPLCP